MTRAYTLALVLFTLALLIAFVPAPAAANTADGETPAVEEVCALESGAAFGLCNAYCEAMDCHLPDADNPDALPHASETACLKVLNRFMQITGRDLPCESAVCPAGTEGCPCDEEFYCEGELLCNEGSLTCEAEGDMF